MVITMSMFKKNEQEGRKQLRAFYRHYLRKPEDDILSELSLNLARTYGRRSIYSDELVEAASAASDLVTGTLDEQKAKKMLKLLGE